MVESFILIVLVVFALITVLSNNLRRSVIYMGVFSLVMALAYLFYNAPDVALAEAAIGVGLSTIMYLVSLKKIRVYTVVFVDDQTKQFTDKEINKVTPGLLNPIEDFLERTEEVEPQFAYTDRQLQTLLDEDDQDLIIHQKDDLTYLYGNTSDSIFQDIVTSLDEILKDVSKIRIIFRDEVTHDDFD